MYILIVLDEDLAVYVKIKSETTDITRRLWRSFLKSSEKFSGFWETHARK